MSFFEDTKSPLLSRGVMGGSAAVILGAAQLAGWAVSPADAADLSQAVIGLATAVSGIVAVVGRIRANTRVALR